MTTAQDSQMLTQHRFSAEIESIGKPHSGGPGWTIVLNWKLPGSNYNQHISGQNWDDIAGFQVGQAHDWVINIGNLKNKKSGRYASDYFWDWDKTGNSKPPVAVAPPGPEADQFFTGKPDTPSGPTGGNYQPSNASRYTKDELIVRQVAAKGAFDMISAQIYMPESFDELLETFYHKIMGYAQPSVADDVSVPPMEVNEEPSPTAPAAPSEHYCAKHQIKYDPYSDGRYGHKWNDDKHWCLEGSESLLDNEGNPVNEAML
jgi:hypothetical protein